MKILIVKPSSFGDIIQASPILQAIRSKWKDSLIDWLVFKQWKQVVELFPNVDDIKCWDRKGGIKAFFEILKECNKENYDFLVCSYYDFNARSKHVQEKCGFKPYRKIVFDTILGTKQPGVLQLLINPKKNIKFEFSHPETLLYKE